MLDKNFLRASKAIRVKILKSKEKELEEIINNIDIYDEMMKCINFNKCDGIKDINLKKEEEILNQNLKKLSLKSEIEYLKMYIDLISKS